MVSNILNCNRELGCRILYQGIDDTPPMVTDYFKFTRKKGYHTYSLYEEGNVFAELYVNSRSILLLFVIIDSQGNGKCKYNSRVIELENDLSSLPPLMKYLLPSTDMKEWDRVIDNLMVCILRDTVNVLQDISCSNCINKECVFRNTKEVCYAYR